MSDWRTQITEKTLQNYAAGKISWREIRHATELADFQIMLMALSELGLKLPRAARGRSSPGKQWLAEVLAARKAVT